MELSLVFFTVLSQGAVGLFAFTFLAEKYGLFGVRITDPATVKRNTWAALGLLTLSFGSSLTHLGDPLGFLRAFTALDSSWLSREALFLGLAEGALVLYILGAGKPWSVPVGWAGIGCGVLGILSAAMIYMLPAVPSWNTWLTPVGFLLTALLLGLSLTAAMVGKDAEAWQKPLLLLAGLGALLYVIGVSTLGGEPAAASAKGQWLSSGFFWFQLLVGYGATLAYLAVGMTGRLAKAPSPMLVFLFLLLGELAGRVAFYGSGAAASFLPF